MRVIAENGRIPNSNVAKLDDVAPDDIDEAARGEDIRYNMTGPTSQSSDRRLLVGMEIDETFSQAAAVIAGGDH